MAARRTADKHTLSLNNSECGGVVSLYNVCALLFSIEPIKNANVIRTANIACVHADVLCTSAQLLSCICI